MSVMAPEAVITDFSEDLYDRLVELTGRKRSHTYVAEQWLEGLLVPLGYERRDQSEVSHALKTLEAAGLIRCRSVRGRSGYHATRRCNYPKPRVREITILR